MSVYFGMRLRRLRRVSLVVCGGSALVLIAAIAVALEVSRSSGDPAAIAYGIPACMIAGVLAWGFVAVRLRCPRCEADLASGAFGKWDLSEKKFTRTIVMLLRPLRCPSCGLKEPGAG